MTLKELEQILGKAGIPVAHYEIKQNASPYIVFQELSTSHIWASGTVLEKHVRVGIGHYTHKAHDESLERLEKALLQNKLGANFVHIFDEENKQVVSQVEVAIVNEVDLEIPLGE